jgi:hypothetical protein
LEHAKVAGDADTTNDVSLAELMVRPAGIIGSPGACLSQRRV